MNKKLFLLIFIYNLLMGICSSSKTNLKKEVDEYINIIIGYSV